MTNNKTKSTRAEPPAKQPPPPPSTTIESGPYISTEPNPSVNLPKDPAPSKETS